MIIPQIERYAYLISFDQLRWTPTATLMYSKSSGMKKKVGETVDGVKVGNTFVSYEYQGKVVLPCAA